MSMSDVKTWRLFTGFLVVPMVGCVAGNRPDFSVYGSESEGKTFYLDGAGNFGVGKESIPLGLAEGGYLGRVEHFIWTTYMGPLVDQMYLEHNRREARSLARRIERYKSRWPDRPVNIVALSAGTGIAVFALEEIRQGTHVDNVVLLSSSLSAAYPMAPALDRVDGGVYVFWSPDDPILRGVVPIVGTVDRAGFGAQSAGTFGMRLPPGTPERIRERYRKVHNVRWYPGPPRNMVDKVVKFNHAGTTSKAFIRELVAPILLLPDASTTSVRMGDSVRKSGSPGDRLSRMDPVRTAPHRASPRIGAESAHHAAHDAAPDRGATSPTRSASD
jgi:hypothetical protein